MEAAMLCEVLARFGPYHTQVMGSASSEDA